MATAAAKKITKHALPDRSVFYVSGAHHESYGSTGHPHDILAVTDDATEVSPFYGRKGMNVAFKVQHFKDVIKLVATSIWTATPTAEQRKLAVLVLNAWVSHANGEPSNHSLLTPQHACGGVSWLRYCFFTVSEDDVVLADKFCERSYNDKIHLVIAIDFTATRQIIRQLHDSLISFDRAI